MVDSPRLPVAATQRSPAANKAALSGALPGAGQQRVATFLFQEGSQGTFALGSRRFQASLQGAPPLSPVISFWWRGAAKANPSRCGNCSGRKARASIRRPWIGSGAGPRGAIKALAG